MARKIDRNLTELSAAERLWLWRHRDKRTQVEAARLLGRALRTYQAQERGRAALWGDEPLARDKPTSRELCALARRRAGWTLRDTAAKVKVSHVTLLRDEYLGAPSLIAFWQAKRFQFPARHASAK